MFIRPPSKVETAPTVSEKIADQSGVSAISEKRTSSFSDKSPDSIQELLEKNLKWSQIIYEQNRKINSKLLWAAVAGWLRLFLILVPLIISLIYLPRIWKDVNVRYGFLFNTNPAVSSNDLLNNRESLLNILPISSEQKERLKAIIK